LSAEDWPLDGGDFADAKHTVGMAQTIPFPGKKKLDRQIGVAGVRLSQAELSLRRLELVREVKTAFYQVLAAERLVDVAGVVSVAESSAATAANASRRGGGRPGAIAGGISWIRPRPSRRVSSELLTARQTLAAVGARGPVGTPISGGLAKPRA
jgi:hypothetical protein